MENRWYDTEGIVQLICTPATADVFVAGAGLDMADATRTDHMNGESGWVRRDADVATVTFYV